MTIKIYKGSNEIGGNSVELKTKNSTILLDYGTPLQKGSEQVKIDTKIDAVLISHPHQDHFGAIDKLEDSIDIYCGELSLDLMNASLLFRGENLLHNSFKTFQAWRSFEIGDFKITPYLVDHSATDAYAFLIEADNQRLLYSGDFRATGRKAKLFENMLKDKKLKAVDILVMEGTMLQRDNGEFPNEQSVEDKIYETLIENNLLSFMIGSPLNIDSIVSAYRACVKADKIFVIDIYTAWVLQKMQKASKNIPSMSWKNVKVLRQASSGQYKKLQENQEYFGSFYNDVFKDNIKIEDIQNNPEKYFLKISTSAISRIIKSVDVKKSNIIYSQWLGYLKEEFSSVRDAKIFQELKEHNNWVYAHTSGHADLPTLQRFAKALKPKKIVPIHTEHKDKFRNHFDNVLLLDDNESYEIQTINKEKLKNEF